MKMFRAMKIDDANPGCHSALSIMIEIVGSDKIIVATFVPPKEHAFQWI